MDAIERAAAKEYEKGGTTAVYAFVERMGLVVKGEVAMGECYECQCTSYIYKDACLACGSRKIEVRDSKP